MDAYLRAVVRLAAAELGMDLQRLDRMSSGRLLAEAGAACATVEEGAAYCAAKTLAILVSSRPDRARLDPEKLSAQELRIETWAAGDKVSIEVMQRYRAALHAARRAAMH